MAENEKEIENKETGGESLIIASEETSTEETSEIEIQEFDPKAFTAIKDLKESTDEIKDSDETTEVDSNSSNDESGIDIDWDLSDKGGESESENNQENNSLDSGGDTENNKSVDEFNYSEFGNDLGIEINSKEDLKKILNERDARIKELEDNTTGAVTNDKINNLKGFVAMEDKELMEADLKSRGFNEEEVDNAVEKYLDNGMMGIEAKKIRNTLNNAIQREQNSVTEQSSENAKQENQKVEKLREDLKSFINESETMFGFKMAKTPEDLSKVREEHFNYTTEKFYSEITKDEKSMVQAAWLWKHRDVIINAAKNKGVHSATKQLVDTLTVPEISSGNFTPPIDEKGFNPKKFLGEN